MTRDAGELPLQIFLREWEVLASQGVCDEVGGAECKRLFAEWVRAGQPAAAPFIRCEANRPAARPPSSGEHLRTTILRLGPERYYWRLVVVDENGLELSLKAEGVAPTVEGCLRSGADLLRDRAEAGDVWDGSEPQAPEGG